MNSRIVTSSLFVLLMLCNMSAFAMDNGLARAPYMGWNTWYCVGDGWTSYTLPELKTEADALVSTGLRDLGYNIMWLDGGWAKARNADGTINPRFDLKEFCTYVHSKKLLAGIYTDTCPDKGYGQPFGSGTHEKPDMDAFVAWGFDAVKVDSLGGPERWRYEKFRDAIAGRMIFNICTWGARGDVLSWGPQVGHSWRTGNDICSGYLVNLDENMTKPELTGPGACNDPDYLNGRLGPVQNKSQFSMWAMMSSPLILGFKVSKADAALLDIYRNKEIIAIDQDPLCYQCRKVSGNGTHEVYKKNLKDGSIAVAFLNRERPGTFKPVTTSKIRLTVTHVHLNAGDTSPSIAEFEVYDGSNKNVALTAKASAATQSGPDYTAAKATDGDINTRWNAANGKGVGEWLQIEFPAPVTVSRFALKPFFKRIAFYEVQYWDGDKWTAVDEYPRGSDIPVGWDTLGINGSYRVRDLWEHADKGTFAGSYTATNVPANGGCVIVKMTPSPDAAAYSAPSAPHRAAPSDSVANRTHDKPAELDTIIRKEIKKSLETTTP